MQRKTMDTGHYGSGYVAVNDEHGDWYWADEVDEALAAKDARISDLLAARESDDLDYAKAIRRATDAELKLSVAERERDEARREKRMAMRLMRARGDRLAAILDTVRQQKGDDLVRAEVEYFLNCDQSEIESRTSDSDIDAALRQASGEGEDAQR